MKPSTDGILLIDFSLRPIYANQRAIEIFSYPWDETKVAFPDGLLAERIRGLLTSKRSSDGSGFVSELRIGNMRYSCRAFRLNSPLFLVVLGNIREHTQFVFTTKTQTIQRSARFLSV